MTKEHETTDCLQCDGKGFAMVDISTSADVQFNALAGVPLPLPQKDYCWICKGSGKVYKT